MPRYYIVTFYRLRSFVLMDRRRVEVLCRHLENFNSLRYKNSDSGTATQDHSLQQTAYNLQTCVSKPGRISCFYVEPWLWYLSTWGGRMLPLANGCAFV